MRHATVAIVAVLYAGLAFGQCPPPGPSNWCSGTYQYDGVGNVKAIGADTYYYDELGRLKNGTADVQRTGTVSRQHYDYDLFGNWTNVYRDSGSAGCLGGCELSPALSVSTTTNHIVNHSAQYDDAGNLTRIDSATYVYDAAGSLSHATASDDRQFLYTADDERIATRNGLSWTWTIRGLDQKVLREFTSYEVSGLPTSNRQWVKDYVWRDGMLLASVAPGSGGNVVQHYHLDHLGTPRMVSNAGGIQIGMHAYYPFGAELSLTPHEPAEELMKFTGHERDLLGNDPHTLDMMHARYEMATLGRFMSMDAANADPSKPQSWNRYAYTLNSPLRFVDQNGKWPTEIHHLIIKTAFPGMDEYHLNIILKADDQQDKGIFGQWAFNSYQHGMRAWYQSADDARQETIEFYEQHLGLAKEFAAGGPDEPVRWDAYHETGILTHFIADSTSPAHRGFQPWGLVPPVGIRGHHDREKTISPEELKMAVTMIRVLFAQIFGEEELRKVTTPRTAGACIEGTPDCR